LFFAQALTLAAGNVSSVEEDNENANSRRFSLICTEFFGA